MKSKIFSYLLVVATLSIKAQIPILNSQPSITNKVIYLDFDGQVVSGTSWNSGNTINALPSTKSGNDIRLIWHRVSEDYRPFDVNVTTDSVRFNNASPTRRIRVVFTPTSAWYGSAGGVAYLNSFTWGGTPGTPCWVFENQLGYSVKNMAEAASHEAGHTLSLRHQSLYDAQCTKTEYHPGIGTGVTGWAPIMGVGYSKNITIWHNGTSATSCTLIQNDHGSGSPGITGLPFLSFLPDDVGNTYASAKILNLNTINQVDSGIITTPTDVDAYRFTICNSRYISVNARPWALDTNNGNSGFAGANLDVKLKLFNASNTLLLADSGSTKLKALVGTTLPAGSYYFTIDGDKSANYSDYGSLGKYYVSIKATNPPTLTNTIVVQSNVCVAQTTTLSYQSSGSPNTWQWNVTGPATSSYNVQSPVFAFNTAGIYTISLLASHTSSPSCPITKTIQIAALPNLSVSSTNSLICTGKSATLTANGASSYTWLPGNLNGISQIVSPTVSTTYTVKAANGSCSNSATISLNIQPDYTFAIAASNTNICSGTTVSLTASGMPTFTYLPGFIITNPNVVTPTLTTNYTVFTTDGVCVKNKVISVNVANPFSINVSTSDSVICIGQTATITSSGANNYLLFPGNLSGNSIVVSPSVGTTYTITGANSTPCVADTIVYIGAKDCVDTGIKNEITSSTISIYPNPADNFFTVETSTNEWNLKVYSAIGSLVYHKNVNGVKQDLITKDWSKGVYIIRVESKTRESFTKKIVLE